ncbi:hypothetical protein DRE_05430 [Drechslerella stenobrocha 248]|uniref:Cytochrome c oxidase assembly protein COX20, mitochondrial n=1 Tax=Drechslerella stenobrocha 248 TaxID=1043628 RepID=W7HZE0_9PEZI|nr:hypothetical protein DRE_05430 [Drechslerella stenobrocha 248]
MANDDNTPPSPPPSSPPPGDAGGSSLPPLPHPSTVGQVSPRAQLQDLPFSEAINRIGTDSVTNIAQMPCFRQAYLTGIGTGFAFGGVKMFLRASIYNSCSWAVGMFCFSSIVVWEACRWRRGQEHDGMVRAMQILEYKRLERERRLEEKKREVEEARLREEEEKRKEAERRKWRLW